MTNGDLTRKLPLLSAVLGRALERAESAWLLGFVEARIPWYRLLEKDFSALLRAGVSGVRLRACYRASLLNRPEIQKVMFEVHGASLLAAAASNIDLHVPRGDGTNHNFDVLATIQGTAVGADVKTRKDEFPFNLPEIAGEEAGIRGGSRATMDRHDAPDLGAANQASESPNHNPNPESTVIRQILGSALAQLPKHGCNMVLFGQIEGDHENLVDALFGTVYIETGLDTSSGEYFTRVCRMQNGAFTAPHTSESFGALTTVIWFRLWRDGDCIKGSYRGHTNPNAQVPLPNNVRERLNGIIRAWDKGNR